MDMPSVSFGERASCKSLIKNNKVPVKQVLRSNKQIKSTIKHRNSFLGVKTLVGKTSICRFLLLLYELGILL